MAHYKFHNDCQSSVLTYEQVKRLDFVIDQIVPIHGRGNYPTLYVKLKELIRLVKFKLQNEHSIEIRDVRLNGGASNYVLAPENSHYNDLDLIFGINLTNEDQFDVIRDVVLDCLAEFIPAAYKQQASSNTNNSEPSSSSVNQNYHNCCSTHQQPTPTTASDNQSPINRDATNLNHNHQNHHHQIHNHHHSERIQIKDLSIDHQMHQQGQLSREEHKVPKENDLADKENIESVSCKLDKVFCNNILNQNTSTASDDHLELNIDNGGLQSRTGQQVARSLQDQYQTPPSQPPSPSLPQMPLTKCVIKEAYVHKMVKVNDDDRWSLISLGVQPSETACCGQGNSFCSQTTLFEKTSMATRARSINQTQILSIGGQQQQQFLVTIANNNNGTSTDNNNKSTANDNKQSDHNVSVDQINRQQNSFHLNEGWTNCSTDISAGSNSCKENTNYNQGDKCQHKQFPNSIELKFVDRMRRKFEFSVDSFQIILDSLIDFYDYAPQSTIASRKMLATCHPSSTIINTRPLVTDRVNCVECYVNSLNSRSDKVDLGPKPESVSKKFEENHNDNFQNDHQKLHRHQHYNHNHTYQKKQLHENISKNFLSEASSTIALTDNSHRYYHLSIDAPNSQSIPSSSGCSSSSSVVSSSSSSLSSCDEDHDFCCEADIPLSNSSTSTSSLMSSPTISSLSLNGSYNMSDSLNQVNGKAKVYSSPTSALIDGARKSETSKGQSSLKNDLFGISSSKHDSFIEYNDCPECFKQRHRILRIRNYEKNLDMGTTSCCAVISENFYPTVIGRSEYGNFKEALYHLEKKLIATRSPEEIRGGGLLKYCNLLVKNYKPKNIYQIRTLERYMCSRFFIDFSDLNQQQSKLESYLRNHFSDDPVLKFDYLTILHNVVQRSTVCLMNHELRLTLNMIRDLAYKLTTGLRQLYVDRM